ncbi:OB-fold domain-containing protein [Alcaligenaceae bacterium]|nr:OB-fold domain-containing protein [Alcaligenaceae bacterium]
MKLETVLAFHPHSKPFWEAAESGRLLLPLCGDCGKSHWYPRPFCPHCHGFGLTWKDAAGEGTIYASTLMRRAKEPYIVAAVELDEGPVMLTNIVTPDFSQAGIGARVKVGFDYIGGSDRKLPVFHPI